MEPISASWVQVNLEFTAWFSIMIYFSPVKDSQLGPFVGQKSVRISEAVPSSILKHKLAVFNMNAACLYHNE